MTIGWHEIELPQIDFNPITNLRPKMEFKSIQKFRLKFRDSISDFQWAGALGLGNMNMNK